MDRVLLTILGHQMTHKLVHGWVSFMHKNGSKKMMYVMPSFLVGVGTGYGAAHFRRNPTILENVLNLLGKHTTESETIVEINAEIDKIEVPPAENQTTVAATEIKAEP